MPQVYALHGWQAGTRHRSHLIQLAGPRALIGSIAFIAVIIISLRVI
jgi:hypothetical protein